MVAFKTCGVCNKGENSCNVALVITGLTISNTNWFLYSEVDVVVGLNNLTAENHSLPTIAKIHSLFIL